MNVVYYGAKLGKLQSFALWVDIVIAVGTSGAIAALSIWNAPGLGAFRAALAALTVLLVTIRPLLNLPRRVERLSKLLAGYSASANALEGVVLGIKASHAVTSEDESVAEVARKRLALAERDDDPAPDKALLNQAYEQVDQEIPENFFWWPSVAA